MKRFSLATVFIAALAAAGCSTTSTPSHTCSLEQVEGRCASVEQAYEASRRNGATATSHQSVFENSASDANAAAAAAVPFFEGAGAAVPQPGQVGAPVFRQPRVMRVWVAPYVDADGNLRSGEYTYFSTPGAWNYGTTRAPGQAAGAFGPVKPDALGFNPVVAPKAPAVRPAAPPAPGTSNTAPPEQVQNITQPYQRLTN
jgi:conjugal transfer pilus assembly protein TraV